MFSQLFFILLAIILINFNSEADFIYWVELPGKAFEWGILTYFILLAFLYTQSKYLLGRLKKSLDLFWWPLVNLELLFFLGIYHFGLGAQRFFLQGQSAAYQTPFIFFSLWLYLLALGWAHLAYAYFKLQYPFKKALKEAKRQLLFIFPFCIPFIILTFLSDGLQFLPTWSYETYQPSPNLFLTLLSLALLGLTFLLLPAFIIVCWRCHSLDNLDLKNCLEKRCLSLGFRHAGLKTWSIMPSSFTAGIIGIISHFRYILFTPALLQHFKSQEIEAILIHEIGHHRYRHLLLYPFIMLGMLVLGTLGLILLEEIVSPILKPFSLDESHFTLMMGIFVVYALLMGLYFRLIFGFFSRLFERQADLYIFESTLSPCFLIQALDRLGIITGYTHSHPSWHHFSLQERIVFLNQALTQPNLIQSHHQRVKNWLIFYFFGLFASCLALYLLI